MSKERERLREIASEITARLIDKGLIVEAGFAGFRMLVMAKDAPDIQVREMRLAFFAGAKHLYDSMMNVLEPGEEPTDKDLTRMSNIHDELLEFGERFEVENLPTKGRA